MEVAVTDPALIIAISSRALFDLDESNAIYEEQGGIISSVCHGTAGITQLKTKDGTYLVAGKTVNGYPDDYEKKEKAYYRQFPFKIQQTIEANGGTQIDTLQATAHGGHTVLRYRIPLTRG